MNYRQLAIQFFFDEMEDTMKDDPESVGITAEMDCDTFTIKVQGYWEKATWMEWEAVVLGGNVLDSGTYLDC